MMVWTVTITEIKIEPYIVKLTPWYKAAPSCIYSLEIKSETEFWQVVCRTMYKQ